MTNEVEGPKIPEKPESVQNRLFSDMLSLFKRLSKVLEESLQHEIPALQQAMAAFLNTAQNHPAWPVTFRMMAAFEEALQQRTGKVVAIKTQKAIPSEEGVSAKELIFQVDLTQPDELFRIASMIAISDTVDLILDNELSIATSVQQLSTPGDHELREYQVYEVFLGALLVTRSRRCDEDPNSPRNQYLFGNDQSVPVAAYDAFLNYIARRIPSPNRDASRELLKNLMNRIADLAKEKPVGVDIIDDLSRQTELGGRLLSIKTFDLKDWRNGNITDTSQCNSQGFEPAAIMRAHQLTLVIDTEEAKTVMLYRAGEPEDVE